MNLFHKEVFSVLLIECTDKLGRLGRIERQRKFNTTLVQPVLFQVFNSVTVGE